MNEKFGFGIIGCGRISSKHVEAIIRNNKNAKLVALSDLKLEKMKKLIRFRDDYINKSSEYSYNKITEYQNYRDLINDDRIDVVCIATESGYHSKIAIEAMNLGKHVIVEKPMALSINDVDEMIKVSKINNIKLAVCHQNRFNPTIRNLRKAIESNRFGKLIHAVASVRWNRNDKYYDMDDWHGTLSLDGGILMNQCIHNIDMLCWMMGDVENVTSETGTFLRNIETEDVGMALIRFKSGAIGLIEGSVCIYPQNLEETFNIFGEKGTVRVAGIALNEIVDWKFSDLEVKEEEIIKESSYETNSVYGYGHNLLYGDMISSIIDDREPLVNGAEGKKAVELILAIYKSSRENKKIKLPLDEYSTLTGVIDNDGY